MSVSLITPYGHFYTTMGKLGEGTLYSSGWTVRTVCMHDSGKIRDNMQVTLTSTVTIIGA